MSATAWAQRIPPLDAVVQVGVDDHAGWPESAVAGLETGPALGALRGRFPESLLLVTCNRIELYALSDEPDRVERAYAEIVRPAAGAARTNGQQVVRTGRRAVEHLFRVAAGLESTVLGESEILGQVRSAASAAKKAGTLGVVLNQVTRGAVRAGRRVRNDTGISRGAGSYAVATLRAAERTLGDLKDRPLLLIGAGDMVRRVAKAAGHAGVGPLTIVNRTLARAQSLATAVGGRAATLGDLESLLQSHTFIVVAVSGLSGLLDLSALSASGPVCVCDLSTPPAIAIDASVPPHVTLHRLPDIVREVDAVIAQRRAAVPAAEQVVAGEVDTVAGWLAGREAAGTVRAVQTKLEAIRRQELKKFESRLLRLDPDQREMVERLTQAIVKSTLHQPLRNLRDPVHGEVLAAALERLFGLEPQPASPSESELV